MVPVTATRMEAVAPSRKRLNKSDTEMRNLSTTVLTPIICLILAAPGVAFSAEWSTDSSITPTATYTDNICLASDDEQGEWIGLVDSNFRLKAKGRNASFDLGASLEVNSLSDSKLDDLGCTPSQFGNREQYAPGLNARADAVLIDNWVFIDGAANVGQNSVNSFLPGGGDSLNRTGNTNTFERYTVSPYISHRFKRFANFQLRYRFDDEKNSEDAIEDSSTNETSITLAAIPGNAAFSWGLEANHSKIDYDESPFRSAQESELESAQVNIGYRLNRQWEVNGFYGEERNDFVSSSDEIDGDFWDVGLRWTPNSRTEVELGTGERFFGSSPRFSISHEYRRSTFSAEFERALTYNRSIRSADTDSLFNGDSLVPVDPVSGLPIDFGGNETSNTTSPILDERLTLRYLYEGRRSTFRIFGSHSDQTRQDIGTEQTFTDASISYSRRLSRSLRFNIGARFSEREPNGALEGVFLSDSETLSLDLGLSRTISSNTTISFDYLFEERESDSFVNEYTENRFTLSFRLRI